RKVEKIRVYSGQDKEIYDYISGNDIVAKVLDTIDNIDVTIIGGPDVLLEVKDKENTKAILEFLKIFTICVILFFGSALTIVYFFEDVGMEETVKKIHFLITGVEEDNPMTFTIPFSVGIGLGIFAFFN